MANRGKVRVLEEPSSNLWVESLTQNPRLVASFRLYMDEVVQRYEEMALDAVREGDQPKSLRLCGSVDMAKLIKLRVTNEDKELKDKAKLRGEM